MDERLQGVVGVAVSIAALHDDNFNEIDRGGGDRHGVWEWSWVRRDENRHVYISLGGRSLPNDILSFEVWACADDGRRFGRMLIGVIETPSDTLFRRPKDGVETFPALVELLKTAKLRAASFPQDHMTGVYTYQDHHRRRQR